MRTFKIEWKPKTGYTTKLILEVYISTAFQSHELTHS